MRFSVSRIGANSSQITLVSVTSGDQLAADTDGQKASNMAAELRAYIRFGMSPQP